MTTELQKNQNAPRQVERSVSRQFIVFATTLHLAIRSSSESEIRGSACAMLDRSQFGFRKAMTAEDGAG
jgi:hypothetical protein